MSKLALFFTEGVTLKNWHDSGLIERDTLLYHHLIERGWEVTFVTYGGADDPQYLPAGSAIKVLTRPEGMPKRQYARQIGAIHGDTLRHVDVIKSHQVDGSRYAVLANLRLRKPYIARCGYLPSYFLRQEHAPRRRQLKKWGEEFLAFHSASAVCVPSQSEIDYLHQRYGIRRYKMHACPNWIDAERFQPDPHAAKNPRRICFIARFEPQKDPLTLLEALKGIDHIELLMIGGGPMKPQVEAKIREYGINATLLDRTTNEQLPGYLNSAAMYVLPTLYEGGSPKSLLEAMACGLPVVSTSAFGVDEAFVDGVHGYKCAPGDVAAFRQSILNLLDQPAEAAAMGQRGRERILSHYAVEHALARELDILQSVTGR